jgi:putative beta-lysine N-acetyltransferase
MGQKTATEADRLEQVSGPGFAAHVLLSDLNRRVQVLRYDASRPEALVKALEGRARKHDLGKVFLKAPLYDRPRLESAGMRAEALITGYFSGQPAVVMSMFLDKERGRPPSAEEREVLWKALDRPRDSTVPLLPGGYTLRVAGPEDAEDLAGLYDEVFESYPFPITESGYLVRAMRSHVIFEIVRDKAGRLVAAASAETSPSLRNAEMTDFATLPDQRGLGLAQILLASLEAEMVERGITNLYTVARARSAGMNRVFYNRGYQWNGTLVKNCHIAGRFEDMHVWCKDA